MRVSKSQVDRLGDRLRRGDIDDADLRSLDEYRKSFAQPYQLVMGVLRDELALAPTGRPAKSTKSIVDKLKRESVRLSQIQDIAGCRVVVPDVVAQDALTTALRDRLPNVTVVDRREQPSHGYRAVHVLVPVEGQHVEVQVRTVLQHLWAELSEKFSDALGIDVKYGGGHPTIRATLDQASLAVGQLEAVEADLVALGPTDDGDGLRYVRARFEQMREKVRATIEFVIAQAPTRT